MDIGRGGGWGAPIGASMVFKVVQMLDIGAFVASCGFAWGLLIVFFMPPPAEGIWWVIDESSRLEINGGCYLSIRYKNGVSDFPVPELLVGHLRTSQFSPRVPGWGSQSALNCR